MKIQVVTLGCKVNQCESASIVAALNNMGLEASEGLLLADVYVLNTCSVTAEADRKCRQYITKMNKLNGDCNIIVVGCSAQNNKTKFAKSNVIAIGGTANKEQFVIDALVKLQDNNHYSILSDRILYDNLIKNNDKNSNLHPESRQIFDKTRAFIKIQDGCNRFCTYCIIPYLRGRSRSRSIADIVEECAGIQSKEVVITGIDISAYGADIGCTLTDLIKALKDLPARKRLGSLECEVITEGLLAAMLNGGFCPHFHLSLQSGDDIVLKSMNRHYTTQMFLQKIQLIRKFFPSAAITTDVIAGFPTETEKLFDNSCQFIRECAFSDIHVFPYSSRAGTIASKKYKTLPKQIVEERVKRLIQLKRELHIAFLKQNLGTVAPVYVEDSNGEYNEGYTPNYIKVYSHAPCGTITDLMLSDIIDDGILGILSQK